MAFRFSMQMVLAYREQLEEEAKADLAQKRHALDETRARLAALEEELLQAEARQNAAALRSAAEGWLQAQYIKGLKADKAATFLQARLQEQLVEEARAVLAARAMDKKKLEKLKERQYRDFLHTERRQEQRANDETATLRYKAPAF